MPMPEQWYNQAGAKTALLHDPACSQLHSPGDVTYQTSCMLQIEIRRVGVIAFVHMSH